MYSCAGYLTCAGYPASYDYEWLDAQTFAEWGVDYLKYDYCFHPASVDAASVYRRMGLALANCGRDILFSACSWGVDHTRQWIRETGAHVWRSTGDINDSWISIKDIAQSQMQAQEYNAPGCYNDMDMLVVGMNNQGNVSLGGCTEDEYRLHFSLWAFLQSPLMIGCDIRHMDEATRNILLNKAVIALNQDESCHQAYIANNPLQAFGTNEQHVTPTVNRQPEEPFYHYSDYCLSRSILVRRLADGDMAVIRLNFRDHETSNAPTVITPDMLGLPEDCTARMQVTDLWTGEEIALVHGTIPNPGIPPHGCQVLRSHLHD
jgi:alpha-galactosidase